MKKGETTRETDEVREKIMVYVKEYQEEHKFSPSMREIGEGCGISSLSMVYNHLRRLQHEGRIMRVNNTARSIVVTE